MLVYQELCIDTCAFGVNGESALARKKKIRPQDLKDVRVLCGTYEYYDRDAVFTCTADTLFKLASGKLDPIFAFTTGKLRVEGNLEKAMKLQNFVKK